MIGLQAFAVAVHFCKVTGEFLRDFEEDGKAVRVWHYDTQAVEEADGQLPTHAQCFCTYIDPEDIPTLMKMPPKRAE